MIKTYLAKKVAEEIAYKHKIIQFHPSYTYEDFVRGIVSKTEKGKVYFQTENKILAEFAKEANEEENTEKDFLLIIDEINRANLPAVLGELIYALEYRGEVVESIYELEASNEVDENNGGSRSLILPNNLYIIGTMNTADKSVGQVDYAVRRRFAFIDVLPDINVIETDFGKKLFLEVSELFVQKGKNSKNLSREYHYKDVQLGHSYFLAKDKDQLAMNLEYEIQPILREYVNDGILTPESLPIINSLSVG